MGMWRADEGEEAVKEAAGAGIQTEKTAFHAG